MGKSSAKFPVGEMKKRPQKDYNDQTKQSTLNTNIMEEGPVVGSKTIDENATN